MSYKSKVAFVAITLATASAVYFLATEKNYHSITDQLYLRANTQFVPIKNANIKRDSEQTVARILNDSSYSVEADPSHCSLDRHFGAPGAHGEALSARFKRYIHTHWTDCYASN